jgi:hypothetical protein
MKWRISCNLKAPSSEDHVFYHTIDVRVQQQVLTMPQKAPNPIRETFAEEKKKKAVGGRR